MRIALQETEPLLPVNERVNARDGTMLSAPSSPTECGIGGDDAHLLGYFIRGIEQEGCHYTRCRY